MNALKRFNVYQELLTGLAYRTIHQMIRPFSRRYAVKAWNFYASVVFAVVAAGVGVVVATASYIGGWWGCGLACFGFFLGNFEKRLILRISAVPLRENWATPFLWTNMLALSVLLRNYSKVSQRSKGGYPKGGHSCVVTCVCVGWSWVAGGLLRVDGVVHAVLAVRAIRTHHTGRQLPTSQLPT